MGLCIVVSLTYKYNLLEHVDALGTDLDSSCTKWMEGTESKPVTGTCEAPVANNIKQMMGRQFRNEINFSFCQIRRLFLHDLKKCSI